MTKTFLSLAVVSALLVTVSGASPVVAAQPGVGYGKTIGALVLETRDLATSPEEVRRQGGFATAGAVHWMNRSASKTKVGAVAF